MNCHDVREIADSFLCQELLTETNHDILRHLDGCPSCRAEIDARRRLRDALRTAFDRAPELQPTGEFANRLRDELRNASVRRPRSWMWSSGWMALAAALVLAAGMTAAVVLNRSSRAEAALARDAIGDHRNCALTFRLERKPVSLDEAAERFDPAYRVLLDTPPDEISTPEGPARVIERHSCEYGAHRFGHIVLQYRGHVVSLLMTVTGGTTRSGASTAAIPHVIGRPMEGLSVVGIDGSRHSVMLVSDLQRNELTQLAGVVSLPLARQLAAVTSDQTNTTAWLLPPSVPPFHSYSAGRLGPGHSLARPETRDDLP